MPTHSWKSVSTSRNVMSEGLPATGGIWLHTMCATGSRTFSPGAANSRLCGTRTRNQRQQGAFSCVCRGSRVRGAAPQGVAQALSAHLADHLGHPGAAALLRRAAVRVQVKVSLGLARLQ